MFDSAIGTWQPGEVGVFGFPYHGRLDAPAGTASVRLVLTLPNSAAMQVETSVANPAVSQALYGNCRVFCDPRAVDVALDEDEEAAAVAAGAQWRKEAIISEIGALGGLINHQIIYHDGERNWGVTYSHVPGLSTMAHGLPVIRVGSDDRPSRAATVTHNYSISAISSAGLGYTGASVRLIDSLPGGSRHLIGLYGARAATARPGRDKSYSGELYALIEVELGGPGASMTASYRLLYSPSDIFGEFSSTETGIVDDLYLHVPAVQWSTFDSGMPAVSSVPFALSAATGSVVVQFVDGSRTVTESCAGCVISAYYAKDGTVRTITKDYVNTLRFAASTSMSVTDTPAAGTGNGGPVFGITLTSPGSHAVTVTETISVTSELRISINDGGEVTSIVGTGSTARTHVRSGAVNITAGVDGIAGSSGSDAHSTTLSCEQRVTHDGHTLNDFSGSASSSFDNPLLPDTSFGAGDGSVSGGFPGLISLLTSIEPVEHGYRLDICPVMYNPSLVALSSRVWGEPGTTAATLRIGDAASRGVTIPGWRVSAIPGGAIYGSVNPLTGQYARDTARPVLWL